MLRSTYPAVAPPLVTMQCIRSSSLIQIKSTINTSHADAVGALLDSRAGVGVQAPFARVFLIATRAHRLRDPAHCRRAAAMTHSVTLRLLTWSGFIATSPTLRLLSGAVLKHGVLPALGIPRKRFAEHHACRRPRSTGCSARSAR